jgi:hypothetical protein
VGRMRRSKARRAEGAARRTFELLWLTLTLIIGLGVVGGCGGLAVMMAPPEIGALTVAALFAGAVVVIGLVYLATSMSRDVRLLKRQLLDRDQDTPR